MKKLLFIIGFLFCAFVSFGQFPNNQSVSNSQTIYHIKGAVKGDVSLMLPVVDTLNNPATPYPGALTVRPQDTINHAIFPIYQSNGTYWSKVSSSMFITGLGIDSVTLYNGQLCQWQGGIQTCYFLDPSVGDSDSLALSADSLWIYHYRNGALRSDSIFLLHTYLYTNPIHFSQTVPYLGDPYKVLLNAEKLVDSIYASPFGTAFNYISYANGNIDSISSGGGSGVQSVTGTLVNNTDPLNPIVNWQTMQQTFEADSTAFPTIHTRSNIFYLRNTNLGFINFNNNSLTLNTNSTATSENTSMILGNTSAAISSKKTGETRQGSFLVQKTGVSASVSGTSGNSTGIGLDSIRFLIQNIHPSTNTVLPLLSFDRGTQGTAANGIGASIEFKVEPVTGGTSLKANTLASRWSNATTASRTSQFDITGVNNATDEVFANFQTGSIVIVGNGADTLATLADVRAGGGGGGGTVLSVTGDLVDNSDPTNPIVNWGGTHTVANPTIELGSTNFDIGGSNGTRFKITPADEQISLETFLGKRIEVSDNNDQVLMSYNGSNQVKINSTGTTVTGNLSYITPPTGAATDSVLTWDAATGVVNKRVASSFGGNTIYTGDGSITGDRTIDVTGHLFEIVGNTSDMLHLESTTDNQEVEINARSNVGSGNYAGAFMSTNATDANFYLRSVFDDGAKMATIIGNANTGAATIDYTADTHTFNGAVTATSLGISSTPDASSLLDVTSTTKGVLIPRMTAAERDAISSPVNGLMIYNTNDSTISTYKGSWKNTPIIPKSASVAGSDATTTSNSLSDITGLSVWAKANKKYKVTAVLQTGMDNTGGTCYAIAGPASSAVTSGVWIGTSTSVVLLIVSKVAAMGVTSATSGSGAAFTRFATTEGKVTVSAYITTGATAGNITLQFRSVTNTQLSSVYIGSTMDIEEVQ